MVGGSVLGGASAIEFELSGACWPFVVFELLDFEDSADEEADFFISRTARAAASFGSSPSARN